MSSARTMRWPSVWAQRRLETIDELEISWDRVIGV